MPGRSAQPTGRGARGLAYPGLPSDIPTGFLSRCAAGCPRKEGTGLGGKEWTRAGGKSRNWKSRKLKWEGGGNGIAAPHGKGRSHCAAAGPEPEGRLHGPKGEDESEVKPRTYSKARNSPANIGDAFAVTQRVVSWGRSRDVSKFARGNRSVDTEGFCKPQMTLSSGLRWLRATLCCFGWNGRDSVPDCHRGHPQPGKSEG